MHSTFEQTFVVLVKTRTIHRDLVFYRPVIKTRCKFSKGKM